MAITILDQSFKNKLNAANPDVIADAMRIMKFGDFVRSQKTFLHKKVPVASGYQLATLQAFLLADDGKALTVTRAYARAGTATAGELAVVAYGTTPATGQIAVAPNGDIVVLAADAWTSVDVFYQPDAYDVAEVTLPVTTNVLTLTAALAAVGCKALLEAEAVAAGSTGKKIILVPGAGAPAAGQARLNLAKTTVTFAGADAVTSARVKLAMVPGTDLDALLTAISQVA